MEINLKKIKIHSDLTKEIAKELGVAEHTVRSACKFSFLTPLGDKIRALAAKKLEEQVVLAKATIKKS